MNRFLKKNIFYNHTCLIVKYVPIEKSKIITQIFKGILKIFIIVPRFSDGRKSDFIFEKEGYIIPIVISYKMKEYKVIS